jgi:hypothetical protein
MTKKTAAVNRPSVMDTASDRKRSPNASPELTLPTSALDSDSTASEPGTRISMPKMMGLIADVRLCVAFSEIPPGVQKKKTKKKEGKGEKC